MTYLTLPKSKGFDSLKVHHNAGSKEESEEIATTSERWLDRHRFWVGVLGATYVGICAGTMMVCLKLAPPDCKGDQYTVTPPFLAALT